MSDYTNLLRMLKTYEDGYGLYQDAANAIEALQAQMPKQGEWLNVTDSYHWYGKCSVCGEEFEVDAYYAGGMNYCPNCGAKMEVQE